MSQGGALAPKQLTQLSRKRLVGKKENAPASVPEPLSLPQRSTPFGWDENIFVLLASAMMSSLITAGLKLRGNNTRQEEHFYMWPVLFMGSATCQQCMQPGGLLLIWRAVHFFFCLSLVDQICHLSQTAALCSTLSPFCSSSGCRRCFGKALETRQIQNEPLVCHTHPVAKACLQ